MSLSTPWSRRLDEILADGAWHDWDELLDDVARLVPPGLAYRRGERNRIALLKSAVDGTTRQRGERDASVRGGARRTARDCLNQRIRAGHVVRRIVAGRRQVRRTSTT